MPRVAVTVCESATASRCPFGAAAGVVGRKMRGSVEGSPPARAVSSTSSALVAVKVTVATPFAFVRTSPGTPLAPPASSETSTFGSALPPAERTRIVAVPRSPTWSGAGIRSSSR